MRGRWTCYTQEEDYGRRLGVLLRRENFDGSISDVSFTLNPAAPDAMPTDTYIAPAADVRELLQAIMDEAWRIGLRPANFGDHASELKAVRYHLEDMRKLAKVAT